MKKSALIMIITLLIPALLLTGCFLFQKDGVALIRDELGLDASAGAVNLLLNTRKEGGEGLTYVSVSFSDNSFSSQLSSDSNFRALPFSKELTELLYSTDFLVDENGDLLFPYAENGYYYFHIQLDEPASEDIAREQGAELSIALYDADENDFYYCHLDMDNINILSGLQDLIQQAQTA